MHRLNLNLADVCHNFTHARPGALRPARLASSCAAAILFFARCTVGPNYVRPTAAVPTDFKETPANWKQAQPSDAVAKGKWWEIYQDSQLNDLEEQINVSNQTLKAEQQQFAQARAALRITRSNLFPNVSTTPSVSRTHLAPNEPLFNPPPNPRTTTPSPSPWTCPTSPIFGVVCVARSKPVARKPRPPARIWQTSVSVCTPNWRAIIFSCVASMRRNNFWIPMWRPSKRRST